ncbi:MAG TPA: response regulator [Thermoanaerobaculia bacterium]
MNMTEKPLVLLVDDNEATCTLVTALLQRDFHVESALDGHEALEKLRIKQYAAILLDLRMPQPDGYAILEFLHSTRPELLKNVLVLTASLTPKELARVHDYKVCGIIPKPFDIDSLLQAVKDCATPGTTPLNPGGLISSSVILLLGELLRRM